MKYWTGRTITSLKPHEVFVFGSNPEGRHGAGAAKAAISFGAVYGVSRGLCGQSYGIVTKNLTAGVKEKSTGIVYEREGFKSVSVEQIKANIDELYQFAIKNIEKDFIITYQLDMWPNGTPKKSLNGYTSLEMLEMFRRDSIPPNIVFHESYRSVMEPYIMLNNTSPALITYKDYTFVSVTQFVAYSLARNFAGDLAAQKILDINQNPMVEKFIKGELSAQTIVETRGERWQDLMVQVQELGSNMDVDIEAYNQKKNSATLFAVREKLNQNVELKQMFMNNADTHLLEDNDLMQKVFARLRAQTPLSVSKYKS